MVGEFIEATVHSPVICFFIRKGKHRVQINTHTGNCIREVESIEIQPPAYNSVVFNELCQSWFSY